MRSIGVAALALLAGFAVGDRVAADEGHALHGPVDDYAFELAAPGTYALPAIRPAADARLLDETGGSVALHDLFAGKLTILAFMYTRCGDICPMATDMLADLQREVARLPDLAGELRLVSVSLDPEHDTPAVMADYATNFRDEAPGAPPWAFLTASDAAEIAPVLAAYGQPVARKPDPDDPTGPFSHLLRVFLVDGEGMIRNIYSADFLDPRLLINDLRTLRLETGDIVGEARP